LKGELSTLSCAGAPGSILCANTISRPDSISSCPGAAVTGMTTGSAASAG